MNKFLEAMTEEDALTANGALTNSTSHSGCLDLFFLAGACRSESQENICKVLTRSYEEDRVKTLKIIFWAGDIRQGAGERRFFKTALTWLSINHYDDLRSYISYVPQFSRWDVLFELGATCAMDLILKTLKEKSEGIGLLCKWLPRRKQYNNLASKIQYAMGWTPKQYRKFIVENTKVVEQQMCSNKWDEITYSSVPSVAMNKYNKAWYRHDQERFEKYLEDVKSGKSKINASAIFPHDIIKSTFDNSWTWDDVTLNDAQITQWNNLPNWLDGKENSIIPVCDVSGSMAGTPIAISVALGLYISERNVGPFKDAFITFSETPTMNILRGDISQRIRQLVRCEWDMNTNFEAVFKLILDKAIKYNLSQNEIPKTILVISDMEFDYASDGDTNFNCVKHMFEEKGYKLPQIVFWNVNGRMGNIPVTRKTEDVALISGASPSIIKAVLTDNISPDKIMNNVIETERYSFIK